LLSLWCGESEHDVRVRRLRMKDGRNLLRESETKPIRVDVCKTESYPSTKSRPSDQMGSRNISKSGVAPQVTPQHLTASPALAYTKDASPLGEFLRLCIEENLISTGPNLGGVAAGRFGQTPLLRTPA
jgi:hypothetical protein